MAWELRVLGIVQDGGMPHPGCDDPPCDLARAGRRASEKVACIGLRHDSGRSILFDATPDLPAQVAALTGGGLPERIFLTHAHIGHYPGLIYLGKEAWNARDVPLHATARMLGFLSSNEPWATLINDGHVVPQPVTPDRPIDLEDGLTVTPLTVPHRGELSDTVGYRISARRASALFIPDIDGWDGWDRDIGALCDEVDWALLDGSFASADELPGRDLARVAHPMVDDTRARLAGRRARLRLIHLNHTNPLLVVDAPDVAREGMVIDL